jgi:hypothetical protein
MAASTSSVGCLKATLANVVWQSEPCCFLQMLHVGITGSQRNSAQHNFEELVHSHAVHIVNTAASVAGDDNPVAKDTAPEKAHSLPADFGSSDSANQTVLLNALRNLLAKPQHGTRALSAVSAGLNAEWVADCGSSQCCKYFLSSVRIVIKAQSTPAGHLCHSLLSCTLHPAHHCLQCGLGCDSV